ncbi:DsbA family protein [Congregibacter variabilis]|uniref:DsbA family protein n=1 Tax=Congregibacter variabilis TaxID=3081200 RepID=A0ABZ0I133_9GAMM|nr:DsbA family protein [Congregibacter sp. IMCC43200]
MLTVYVDFKSLPSYLALKPTLALANRYGVSVDWRPFVTWERDIPQETHDAALSKRHHEVRMASQRSTDLMYAALQGMHLTYPEIATEANLALAALALLKGDKTAFVQETFDAYWQRHANLNDKSVVGSLLSATGFDLELSAASAPSVMADVQSAAQEAGVVDAPCFVIATQLFVGRQHLPWIEECLLAELSFQ